MADTYKFKHGGLMRCCLASLDDEMLRRQQASEPLMNEGDTLKCKYCNDEYGMVCKDGYWQWAKPENQ